MYLKKILREKIWIPGIVLLICGVLTLNRFYFISDAAQNIYYVIYSVLSIITIGVIFKEHSLRIHHGFFILLNLLLIYVAFLNHFIALPLLLVFPLLSLRKSHWIFKVFSSISYILLLFAMLITLFVRLFFSSTTLVKTADSPNKKQMIEVYSVDEGALGGSTYVHLADKYFRIFKKNRLIYSTGYGEANDVKWIDSSHVQIDGRIIDISSQ